MSFEQLAFYFFASVAIISAGLVVTVRNPVRAALFLILSFFSAACLWLMLEAEFLAIVLILVYVGAVMVLFLFVVMMLDIDFDQLREGFTRYLPIGATVGVLILLQLFFVLTSGPFELDQISAPDAAQLSYSNTEQLGLLLYTYYVYPFELAAVLLLLAIIAAISLTLRRRPETRKQQPHEQVAVKRKDRVRLVKMKAEKQD
jgi:NADH-quinone oxidoreductase subunit J